MAEGHAAARSTVYAPAARAAGAAVDTGRLILVSNRLPVTVKSGIGEPRVERSVGGLASGLRAPHERPGSVWVGWPGPLERLEPAVRERVLRRLSRLRVAPIALTSREVRAFYQHIANGVLWPICHDRLDHLPLRVTGWRTYERINARFADAAAAEYRPGDAIWVHDYHLLRVPALLRERVPEARVGFFLHVPFPNPEIFFALPTRRWLVEGMLGADVIGFHTRRYRGHFTAALRRLLDVEMDADGTVSYQGRRIVLGVFPMGVDAAELAERAAAREVTSEVLELRSPTQRLLVGVDRLDYSKGIPRRLLALERLLQEHPEWRERVRLVQVAVPSRSKVGAYRQLRREVDALVGRINGRFATPAWTPIHYLYRSVPETMLLALYRTADVMLVTPVRDGMNLVAKEFVAARTDESGVLLLSEFAGAAEELTDALLVNPYDVDGVAEAIHRALVMDPVERRRRMSRLRLQVAAHDVHHWSGAFLDALAGDS
ncbi:MAG TPA: bifunctional alpha,alpha-trehalose-phosphate synthase (UDP-forming)/trehalose-phosphatase [Gemmatimonadaceae bacterium]|nr:bifunctional alpha,alpha-trehalose-phosphate synthase (UDP-forming)/trehalose-phosphatase [Gemmatimonadaceae bacterium]